MVALGKKEQPLREIKEEDAEMLNYSIIEVGRYFQDHLVQPTLKAGITQLGLHLQI